MNLIVIVILLLAHILFSESFTSESSNSFRKLAYFRASVDSYILEARELLSPNISDVEIMKVALLLSIKEKEKELIEKEKDYALSIKENYYLKKLSVLSLRYYHTY
jgi:hypothetical protein